MGKYEYISEIEFIDIFADNLRSLMEEVGITQAELADESGLTRATINRYLKKQRMPDLRALINICYILECEVTDLIPTYALIH